MKILLDQNIPISLKPWLNAINPDWEVYHTSEMELNSASDEKIFSIAQEKNAVIITFDEDFTDTRMFQQPHAGVVRLNVWPTTIDEIQNALKRLFSEIKDDEINNSFIIIDKNKIRIRKTG
ncbi:MAG: DUF5615 family PIN-like protein [Spirochaetia bacterium]